MHLSTYRLLLCLLCCCAGPGLLAQDKQTQHGEQQWLQYYNQTRLSNRWSLFFDAGFRWKDHFSHRTQYISRLAMGYHLTDNADLGLGFAHLGTYGSESLARLEYRPYQEVALRHRSGATSFSHRFRLEERFFKINAPGRSDATHTFNWRIRYRFSWNIPLFSFSGTHPERKTALNLADEVFLNAGRKVVYNVFDQNRLLLGLAIPLQDKLTINLTYSKQYAGTNMPATYIATDVFWLGLVHKMDLVKETDK